MKVSSSCLLELAGVGAVFHDSLGWVGDRPCLPSSVYPLERLKPTGSNLSGFKQSVIQLLNFKSLTEMCKIIARV